MADRNLKEKAEYQKEFESGTQDGFRVTMARQYYPLDYRTQEPDPTRPQLEQTMETPFVFHDQPVIGYTITDLSAKNSPVKGEGLRPTITHEFYIQPSDRPEPKNIDDVIQPNEKYVFTDKNTGADVSLNEARDRMGKFASAASEYPHVFTPDEYMETRSYLNGRLGLDMPTSDDYAQYLGNVDRQLEQRITFVGAVTKPADMTGFRNYVGFPEDGPSGPNPGDKECGE